jgi:hypothetical protein
VDGAVEIPRLNSGCSHEAPESRFPKAHMHANYPL